MSIFSQKNFGLSDSLIDAARTVSEGKARFKVGGKEGTKAARYMQDAETSLFARDEKDAAKKAIGDFKMKGVSINDLYVKREGFEYGDSEEISEAFGKPPPGQEMTPRGGSMFAQKARERKRKKEKEKAKKKNEDVNEANDRVALYVGVDEKEVSNDLRKAGVKIYDVEGSQGDKRLIINKKDVPKIKKQIKSLSDDDFEEVNEAINKPSGMKVEKYKDWTKRVMSQYSDVAFNEKDPKGKRVEAEVKGKGVIGTFEVDNPPVQSHKDGTGTLK